MCFLKLLNLNFQIIFHLRVKWDFICLRVSCSQQARGTSFMVAEVASVCSTLELCVLYLKTIYNLHGVECIDIDDTLIIFYNCMGLRNSKPDQDKDLLYQPREFPLPLCSRPASLLCISHLRGLCHTWIYSGFTSGSVHSWRCFGYLGMNSCWPDARQVLEPLDTLWPFI